MNKFNELGINKELCEALEKMNITNPTKIQEEMIPKALEGKNIIAQSQTGTGKTLAYVLPILNRIEDKSKDVEAIILAPTHELTMQIHNTIIDLKRESGMKCGAISLAGSGNVSRQIEKLKDKPQIATGSPGRILDLIKKKKLKAHKVKFLVVDEFDHLMDKNNIDIVKNIIKTMDNNIQMLMVSATSDVKAIDSAKAMMNEAEIIKVSSSDLNINPNIIHEYFLCDPRRRDEMLRKIAYWEKNSKCLVFVNNNFDVEVLVNKLKFHNLNCGSICGEISKDERKKSLQDFRNGKTNILIASDVGARGLDIKGITHVINFDMPKEDRDYVHRAGRVARGDNSGKCISIVSPKEISAIERYRKIFNIEIQEKILYKGKIMNYEE